jgi:hypothetical protein
MVMIVIMIMAAVLTGRGINPSTPGLTMVAAAGLPEYDSPPQIPGQFRHFF